RDALRADIRLLPNDASPGQKAAIEEKCQRLAARIAKFHEAADSMTAGMDLHAGTVHSDDPRFCGIHNDGNDWEVLDDEILKDVEEEILAEEMSIWMP
ncbi:uncharacterized protein EDB93DRAFT_1052473, partial [Suillus bovinus]|uniref:uncharacterized protein n=1 Tax=Suillus bovinus TaxID=48563 RepID=UPI001B85E729